VLINRVFWNSPASAHVRDGDVLLAIDGHEIADDGTSEFRPGERVIFGYYADLHQLGDEIRLTLLREGREHEVRYRLTQRGVDVYLVPPMIYGVRPRYHILGGIVFSPLTKNLICEWKNCKAPKELLVEASERPDAERSEVVVAVQVLPADVNKGYHDLRSWIVRKVNGKGFRDFNGFLVLLKEAEGPFVVFSNKKGFRVVLDLEESVRSGEDVLSTYNITEGSSRVEGER
jgi:hypothetical protein